ncbi:MAG: decaprenyl-phosphate phosphoribosyltransferase [Bacteroidales bacterium]|nr:decaprenyl-phosphate phosphoribosyltransferase [Bacteroidales bacterium]
MDTLKNFILLIRPQQWVKNFFIFLPMFFFGSILDSYCWRACIMAFIAFSLIASSIYCLNDIMDVEADRRHPKKRNRPIASGKISIKAAYIIMGICIVLSYTTLICANYYNFFDNGNLVITFCTLYLLMNIAYSLKLKSIAIVDVFIIALGFVFRIFTGGFAAGIPISHWIILLTFLLALFLALSKRRDDVLLYNNTGEKARDNILRYNVSFLNQTTSIVASITMVCYIMYTVSEEVVLRTGTPYLYITSIFVLAGIIRYLQITVVDAKSGSPTKILLKDRFIQLCILCWGLLFIYILYF